MTLLSWSLVLSMTSLLSSGWGEQHVATETEMFSIPITPNMFNWTYQEFDQQYRFHASLLGKPELPSWLRYVYSGRHHAGFVYGTAPRGLHSAVTLEVIGLNRQDYETRRTRITLNITRKEPTALPTSQLQLKIDNLNVEDLLDHHRMERLIEIFTSKLWPDSEGRLFPTFLASAIDMGARLPLKPNEGEGLVVRLGSAQPLSSELRRLREEVQPLARLATCPREFKRTTVERLFRLASFTLDWCSFKLYEVKYTDGSTEMTEILDDQPGRTASPEEEHDAPQVFAPRMQDVPARSYARELLMSAAVVLLMSVPVTALTAALCCHYSGIAQKPAGVELCRYGTEDGAQNTRDSGTESAPVSPSNSLVRPYSPKSSTNLAANYNRPQPPPYLGLAANTLLKSATPSTCSGQSPEHTRTLEESLQLLNDANIANDYVEDCERIIPAMKETIVDPIDGMEDYVPLKQDAGYVQMKADLGYVTMKSDYGNGVVGKGAF